MDNMFYLVLVEQMLAGLTVAATVVFFGRVISKILLTMTEPHLHIRVVGDVSSSVMHVDNHSPCEVAEVAIDIFSADPLGGDAPTPIYSGNWKSISSGASAVTEAFAMDKAESSSKTFTPSELLVRWTLVRNVDRRRFSSVVKLKRIARPQGQIEFLCLTERLRLSADLRADIGQPAVPAARFSLAARCAAGGQAIG